MGREIVEEAMPVSERDLERLAPQLGGQAGDALDVARVTDAVVARLRAAPARPRPERVYRWLAAAAAVILVAGASWLTFGTAGAPPLPALDPAAGIGLSDLSTGELRVVLDSLTEPSQLPLRTGVSIDDLDAEQLRELLAMMEG